ncbi:uncharacterized protein LOC110616673 [Manihot esculenta]|uniref:Uncharacterized protein n=1 Tax=Manihot esculenta TaxID=3983 RepID=A0A2C9VNC4_MANES|nr:uncharacterized protein LOC110616673 [Manihot esculenta]OAY47221.1 hypothetical protein MANES_06G062300v8 [Manihot esculenta]
MASFIPSSCSFSHLCRLKELKHPQVKSQSFKDDGTSANIVDANMGVLRERVAEMRTKERLEKCCRLQNGWNYGSAYVQKHQRYDKLSECLEAVFLAGGALGFVFLSGSLCLCLVSLLVHFKF